MQWQVGKLRGISSRICSAIIFVKARKRVDLCFRSERIVCRMAELRKWVRICSGRGENYGGAFSDKSIPHGAGRINATFSTRAIMSFHRLR